MLASFGETLCSLFLATLATFITQCGGRKLTYITMTAICNLRVEYGCCTVKQMYENILNNVVKVTDGI
jgi:hypothetical protein